MKKPKEGRFIQKEGSVYAENDVTKDEIIFFADESVNLCFRSMMEDDVNKVAEAYGANARKRKAFAKLLMKKDSQLFNFVIEEMNICDEKGERKIVGDCQINDKGETFIQLYIKKDMNYKPFLRRTLVIVRKMLEEFRLDSIPRVFMVSKKKY